jgi:hypothetical protein
MRSARVILLLMSWLVESAILKKEADPMKVGLYQFETSWASNLRALRG